jgi:hypothetical protein
MERSPSVVIDFVAEGERPDEWRMVLVEEGPWRDNVQDQLRRVQARLYDAIDAALDGQLANKFPQTRGKKVVVQLDAYNVPGPELAEFFARFSDGALSAPDYKAALARNEFVEGLRFHLNLTSIS